MLQIAAFLLQMHTARKVAPVRECELTLGFYCSSPDMSTYKPRRLLRGLQVEPAPVFFHTARIFHICSRDNPVDSRGRPFNIAVLFRARGAPRANYSSTHLDELKVLR
jgi:hypothetical protein